MKLTISVLPLVLSLAACGASELTLTTPAAAPAAGPAEPAAEPAAPAHDEKHADLPPELVAFHDVLSPLWHDETSDRKARACGNVKSLGKKAAPLATVELAADKKDAWGGGVTALETSIEKLQASCNGKGDFAASFTAVHDAFHALLELAGGGHGHGGEHGHGGHH